MGARSCAVYGASSVTGTCSWKCSGTSGASRTASSRRRSRWPASSACPILATNGVLYAEPEGQQVLDVLTCARFHTHLDAAGQLLSLNGARCLKSARQMQRLFSQWPEAITNTLRLAERLEFSLDQSGLRVPALPHARGREHGGVPAPRDARRGQGTLRQAHPQGAPATPARTRPHQQVGVRGLFPDRLGLGQLRPGKPHPLVQGRGSAANSAVCYSLGITAVDAVGQQPALRAVPLRRPQRLARHRPGPALRRTARAGHPGSVPTLRSSAGPP